MKIKYTRVILHIIGIFTIAMLASYIPDLIPKFFGDWLCTDITNMHYGQSYYHPHIHWGYRHWLFFAMGVSLFIVGFFRIVDIIESKSC